jgi:ligand-binding sensor domain-containing protein
VTAPTGVTPAVVVSGPNGYTITLAATDTLENLTAGSYAILADTFAVPDSVVGEIVSIGAVTGSPATIAANMTATASITYGQTVRRGGVWIANGFGTAISGFASADLRASGRPTPADTIGGIPNSWGVAIDASGNLWVASIASSTLRMYTIAQRGGGGSPTPAIEITSPSLGDPRQLVFDANGTLWVADAANGLIGFTKDKLTATGTVTATYTVPDTGADPGVQAVAFDAHGTAWVAGTMAISAYTPAQLTASGSQTPQTILPGIFYALAFDTSGNLWAGAFGSVSEYPAGTTASTIQITTPAADARVLGLGFDHRGTMWVVQAEGNAESALLGYPAPQLLTSSSLPSTVVALIQSIVCPGQLAFDPFGPDVSFNNGTSARVLDRAAAPHARGARRVAPRSP